MNDDSTLDADERDICIYLESCPGPPLSGTDIAKRAGGKRRYQENPNWAVKPLLRLLETGLIETDSNGHYRIKPTGKTGSQQSASSPVSPSVTPHWSVRSPPVAPDVRTSKKILYVDDDKDWLSVVAATLHDAGYVVLTAKDATEAIRLTEGVKLGLIILDLDLDGEDGLLLMKFFKRNQPDVPIVLYTGLNHDDDAILEMLRQGALRYVRKGPLEDLHKAVQMALR
jgi:CheY-like chemotaxis protein